MHTHLRSILLAASICARVFGGVFLYHHHHHHLFLCSCPDKTATNKTRGRAGTRRSVCPVTVSAAGDRLITFQLRQLLYSKESGAFEPVDVHHVPATVSALLAFGSSKDGLAGADAARLLETVGPNRIALEEPNVW